jgi:ferredoxin, 2Fe-2S
MSKLTIVSRNGAEKEVEGQPGVSVMEIIRGAGFDEVLALCGGTCSCATCHVHIDEPHFKRLNPVSNDENDLLSGSDHRTTTSRLSCQIIWDDSLSGLRAAIAPAD